MKRDKRYYTDYGGRSTVSPFSTRVTVSCLCCRKKFQFMFFPSNHAFDHANTVHSLRVPHESPRSDPSVDPAITSHHRALHTPTRMSHFWYRGQLRRQESLTAVPE